MNHEYFDGSKVRSARMHAEQTQLGPKVASLLQTCHDKQWLEGADFVLRGIRVKAQTGYFSGTVTILGLPFMIRIGKLVRRQSLGFASSDIELYPS